MAVRNDAMEDEFRAFAKTYFSQFQRTPLGMIRLDPQDKGAGYRNVIGIPGGVRSPLMKVTVWRKGGCGLRPSYLGTQWPQT